MNTEYDSPLFQVLTLSAFLNKRDETLFELAYHGYCYVQKEDEEVKQYHVPKLKKAVEEGLRVCKQYAELSEHLEKLQKEINSKRADKKDLDFLES